MFEIGGVQIETSTIALVISISSLVASVITYKTSISQHSDEWTATLIRHNYEDMLKLHELRATFPMQSHLFELGAQYDVVINIINESTKSMSKNKKTQYYLEERAMARRIFSMYEGAYYQYSNAKDQKDIYRMKFLGDVLFYFCDRLLTNPRLAWFWKSDGGGLCAHYEVNTVAYYDKHVSLHKVDSVSPFISLPKLHHKENKI